MPTSSATPRRDKSQQGGVKTTRKRSIERVVRVALRSAPRARVSVYQATKWISSPRGDETEREKELCTSDLGIRKKDKETKIRGRITRTTLVEAKRRLVIIFASCPTPALSDSARSFLRAQLLRGTPCIRKFTRFFVATLSLSPCFGAQVLFASPRSELPRAPYSNNSERACEGRERERERMNFVSCVERKVTAVREWEDEFV